MATILIINGRHEGEWYTISDRPLVFGRDDKLLCEIIDPRVSRKHLEVMHDADTDEYLARDLNSRNGTRINGQKITYRTALKEGDLLQIGHTMMVFTQRDFDEPDEAEEFLQQHKARAGDTLSEIEEREQYTEAAALFSRLFKGRRK